MIVAAAAARAARESDIAAAIRVARLLVVLRRVSPQARLLDLVTELADAGVFVFEITFDGPDAAADLAATRSMLAARSGRERRWVGAGTIRTPNQVHDAVAAGAAFGVSPILDMAVIEEAHKLGLPFVPGAYSPTEADAAWRAGAAFVKLFPGSSLGPGHVRELRGPLPEIETIVTGGVDETNALAFLEAGATAVGIGSAIVRAEADTRAALVATIASFGTRDGSGDGHSYPSDRRSGQVRRRGRRRRPGGRRARGAGGAPVLRAPTHESRDRRSPGHLEVPRRPPARQGPCRWHRPHRVPRPAGAGARPRKRHPDAIRPRAVSRRGDVVERGGIRSPPVRRSG